MECIPVAWWISRHVSLAAPRMLLEWGMTDALGQARGWLLERLGRYPEGYHGAVVARLEEYDAGVGTLDPRPLLSPPVTGDPSATARAARLVAADLYRLGATFKRRIATAEEGQLVVRMHDVAGRLEAHRAALAARIT